MAMQPRSARPKVLLTGFEPFGGDALNPSWQAAQALHGRQIAGHRIVAACLPTAFASALPRLHGLLAEHRPVLAIALGLAGGRAAISLERVAINLCDARIPDNEAAQPIDVPVHADGPAAYFTSLPVKAMRRDVMAAGIPAELSATAGTFVCNQVFYGLMHTLATRRSLRGCRGGFIHVPWLSGQGHQPAMDLDVLVQGLAIAIRSALTQVQDLHVAGGSIS